MQEGNISDAVIKASPYAEIGLLGLEERLVEGGGTVILESESLVVIDSTAGSTELTLDNPATAVGMDAAYAPVVSIIRQDSTANTVTLLPPEGGTINGRTNLAVIPLQAYLFTTRDGSNWVNMADAVGASISIGNSTITNNYATIISNQVTIAGTTNFVVFGGTNAAPADTGTVVTWVSVQVSGDTNAYRLPLYK